MEAVVTGTSDDPELLVAGVSFWFRLYKFFLAWERTDSLSGFTTLATLLLFKLCRQESTELFAGRVVVLSASASPPPDDSLRFNLRTIS